MDIKHLQYFLEVAKHNSFSVAAERLFITQPTISKMIKNLEDELGVTLFVRSRKNLTLTDAGQMILEQAALINQAFHNLNNELNNLLDLKKGHIRMGLPPIFDAHFLLQLIGRFHEKYPGITFQLGEDGSKKIEEDVSNNNLDVGVVVTPINNELFMHYPILEEDLMLILHPSHPFAERETVNLAELSKESFILFNKDFTLHDRIIFACNNVGFNPHIVSKSSQWSFIEEMVSWNLGVSLLPESICKNLQKKVVAIKVVNPSIRWELAIIWNKNDYLSYAAKEWLEFTKEQLANNHPLI